MLQQFGHTYSINLTTPLTPALRKLPALGIIYSTLKKNWFQMVLAAFVLTID